MNTKISMKSVRTLSRQQNETRREFKSAESVNEMLKAFREMEDCFTQSDLGLECLSLARKLFVHGCDRKEVIRFGKRALKILNTNVSKNIPCFGNTCLGVVTDNGNGSATCSVYHKSSLYVSCVLHVLGAACIDLRRFDDAVSYLKLADKYLSELEEDSDSFCVGNCVRQLVIGTQFQLYRVNVYENKFVEAAPYTRKILEIKEKMLEEDCIKLGEANMSACEAYCAAMDVKTALTFGLKALEIRVKHFECDSDEVAATRSTLEFIYSELGEHEKANEQKLFCESSRDEKDISRDPKSLIEVGRYEDAIAFLKGVISHDGMLGDERASRYVYMATAYCKLRKFSVAKKHLRTARGLLERKGIYQNYAAILYGEMSDLYAEMNDSETALFLTRRVLAMSGSPQNIRSESSARLFSLTFVPAKNVDEMLKAFKQIEACCEEPELALGCWKIAEELLNQGRSPKDVVSFGNRALGILVANDSTNNPCFGKTFSKVSIGVWKTYTACTHYHKLSLYIARVCNLLASACLKLKRYDEGLSYLNWSSRNLGKLEEEGDSSCGSNCVLQALVNTQKELCNVKEEMGRFEEVLHLRKKVDIQEKIMVAGSIELGESYVLVSGAYCKLMNFEEALPFYLKSVDIHTKHLGCNSVAVAKMTKQLAVLYNELGEYEKALEQNELSRDNLKDTTPASPELLDAETDYAKILIGLGKLEEAVDVLHGVISHTDTEGAARASAFVTMARAFCCMEKFADARKYMKTAQRILEKKKMSPIDVAIGFRDMSRLYEKMNEFEKAISLLRGVLAIPDIPKKLLAQSSTTLFSLISLYYKVRKGIPYMEDVVVKLEGSFGPQNCELGYGYRNLGAAYYKSGQEELAVKFVVKAKDIMDVTLGPCHLDSLKTSQTLAEIYATLKSYDLAIVIQEEVVKGLKGLGPNGQEKLDEAVSLLKKLELTTRVDSESFPVENSKCGVSEDG